MITWSSFSHRLPYLLAVLWALVPLSHAVAQPLRPAAAAAVDRMELAAGGGVSVTNGRRGLVRFVSTAPGAGIPVSAAGPAEDRARSFLGEYGDAFGIGREVAMATTHVSGMDAVGMEHVRFQQTYDGIPVTGGELTVHLNGRSVVAVNARTVAGLDGVATTPVVTAAEALVLARDELSRSLGVTDATLSTPRLEILDKGHLGDRGFSPILAWFIEARKFDLRQYLWIDATAGKTVLSFSQLTEALDRSIYDANDPGDGSYGVLPGALIRVEGGAPVVGAAAADANAAYDYAGDTYNYYETEHGRDSYDDAGASLIASVRFCPDAGHCPYQNAYWNGSQMVYGAGYSVADDVDAHELTHAVTEHSASLFYYMQSGALNESYSDIFGETVDLTNGSGTDTAGVRWLLGEDVPGSGAIRDMMDPTAYGDPGKMSDSQLACSDDYRSDNGGVHTNSGIPNHAYALMVDGGSYNGQAVSGIGLTKAGKIEYRALTVYLLSASDFLDNDNALNQSCQDLLGVAGITQADCTNVGKALDAVEMSQPWDCTPAQAEVPAFCPSGQGPSLWYYEDFESGAGAVPNCSTNGVLTTWCVNQPSSLLGSFATSGVKSLWGYDRPTAATTSVQGVFGSMPPANSRFQFNHSFGFDNYLSSYYDGGQIQLTTNGGSTWFDAGSLISDGASYGGTLSTCCSNPLGGQSAFVRDSWGYTASQLDLSSLSGTAFGFRFAIGSDLSVDEYGWFVDDLRIYTCPTCLTDRTLDGAYSGMGGYYKASNSITAGNGFTVQHDESVTFEVGNFVALTDGFTAGGSFTVITNSNACP